MAGKKFLFPFLFLTLISQVKSATLIETSYEYVMNFGKSIAPSLMSIWDCMGEVEAWSCAKEKAGKILDGWGEKVESERRSWQEAADAEVSSSGRSFEELPSKIGEDVESSLNSLAEILHHGVARALQSRKHDSGGGIDSITISTAGDKKMKKKKQKPPRIHLIHPAMMPSRKVPKEQKGRSFPIRQTWVIGERIPFDHEERVAGERDVERDEREWEVEEGKREKRGVEAWGDVGGDGEVEKERIEREKRGVEVWGMDVGDGEVEKEKIEREKRGVEAWGTDVGDGRVQRGEARGVLADLWGVGADALDVMADSALEADNKENGVEDKSSFAEQRGKKKKKKKAILKLLILGAVLKAKIGTLLQILSFKLQVKFFIVAVLGLAINLARLWIDLKNKHQNQPQKVIYYEHAQHQHHYDHEDEHESHGWGPWSRSMEPEETDVDVDVDLQNSPYRGQARNTPFSRPAA